VSFANLSLLSVVAGVAALAGVLFLLQRLRVRHREVVVITTQFWREATEEAQARVLVDRFRHPLAYLFVLLIGALLWLGVAGPRADAGDGRDHALLLDASAEMAWPGRFADARDRLSDAVAALPRDRTTVVLCGARPRTVLLPGENALLLDERLAGVRPDPCPETVTSTLRELAAQASPERALAVRVFGDAPLPKERLDLLPEGMEVARDAAPPRSGANAGITALGVAEAASGAWSRVDVLVGAGGSDVAVTLDGERYDGAPESQGGALIFRDVPAQGGTFVATVADGGAIASDDSASVALPSRRAIRVSIVDDAPAALRRVLAADPAVEIVTAGADVVVARGVPTGGSAPGGIVLRDEERATAAFVVHGMALRGEHDALHDAVRDLALDRIDATSLATDAGKPVTVTFVDDGAQIVEVWESLFTDAYDFTRQRAFPLFVARAIRRAAGAEELIPVVAAGEALPAHIAALVDPENRLLRAAGGTLRPFESGTHTTPEDRTLHVAALTATAGPSTGESDGDESSGGVPIDLALLLGLVATALLCGEWFAYRAGRMP
jgi:hypothetical protein